LTHECYIHDIRKWSTVSGKLQVVFIKRGWRFYSGRNLIYRFEEELKKSISLERVPQAENYENNTICVNN